MKKQPIHIILFFSVLLLAACSAQKNTGLSRAYHNLTAKYNVLFNGKESFKDGLNRIDKGYKDDFSNILPVFNYESKEAVALASSEMEKAIKKCSKLITLHSITAKPKARDNKTLTPDERAFFSKKEYNAFVDDAYLLMGKAHFYKHEYPLASEIFRRIINDFKNQTSINETQVWLARASIETGQFIDAADILSGLTNNTNFPKKLLPLLYPTYADFYLKQKDYPQAISFLEKTVKIEKQKKTRTRYLYILAQLYEKTGDLRQASNYYAQVIKLNPVYDMAFNAHINRALAYEQGFGQGDDIENELLKMLKDDKNLEYQDQIYYALGNLAIKEGNEEQAVNYYLKSIEANKGNDQQKIRSYLTLANHYYSLPDYPKAQAYYDSTLSKIDPDFPGYNLIFTKSKSLTRLVTEINTVTLQDSLLALAKLPPNELTTHIDAIIEDERKKEEEARLKEQTAQLDEQFGQNITSRNTGKMLPTATNTTQWYFYNDATKSMGYGEFKLKWGNRRLEDHWQRASKAMVNFMPGTAEENAVAEDEKTTAEGSYNKLSREFYLSSIPHSDSAVAAAYNNIEMALYNMGLIYKNDLKDYDKAIESFKELIKRFPKSPNMLSSYYNLYGIAREQNNQALTEYYKNIIARDYPESMYARVLTDPEYFINIEKEDQAINDYYAATYALYQAGNYSDVIARTDNAKKLHPDNKLIPLFTYLHVLAQGKTSERKDFRDSLLTMVAKYPGTEIASDARNLINYMDHEHPEIREAEELKISQELYNLSPTSRYYFAFALNKQINTNQLVFNIINYNLDHFDSLNLIVEIVNVNPTQNLVMVRTFSGLQKAVDYLNNLVVAEEIRKDMPDSEMIPFVISDRNLNTLRTDKSVDRYLKFYNENYR